MLKKSQDQSHDALCVWKNIKLSLARVGRDARTCTSRSLREEQYPVINTCSSLLLHQLINA